MFGVCLSLARLNIKVCRIDKQILLVRFRQIGSRGVATCTHSTHVLPLKVEDKNIIKNEIQK